MHGDPNSIMHKAQTLTPTRKDKKNLNHKQRLETLRKLGTGSNLVLSTTTARGGSRASIALALPPSGSPATRNTKKDSPDQISPRRNPIQSTQKKPNPDSNQGSPHPNMRAPTLTLFFFASRAAAADAGDAASLYPISRGRGCTADGWAGGTRRRAVPQEEATAKP
jgi:hypothetical protein